MKFKNKNCDTDYSSEILSIIKNSRKLKKIDSDGQIKKIFSEITSRLGSVNESEPFSCILCFKNDERVIHELEKVAGLLDGKLTIRGELIICYAYSSLRKVIFYRKMTSMLFEIMYALTIYHFGLSVVYSNPYFGFFLLSISLIFLFKFSILFSEMIFEFSTSSIINHAFNKQRKLLA